MFNKTSQKLQAERDAVNQALAQLQNQHIQLKNQQTRLNLLQEVQRHGVTRQDYAGFQPKSLYTMI